MHMAGNERNTSGVRAELILAVLERQRPAAMQADPYLQQRLQYGQGGDGGKFLNSSGALLRSGNKARH